MENFHLASAFEVMKSSTEFDILKDFAAKDKKAIRETIIKAVFSTDMAKH